MAQDGEKIHLNVPAHRQTKNFTCVPSCCKMMLDYLNKVKLTIPEPTLDEDQIAEIMNTSISGTRLSEVENINDILTTSNPSVEFVAEFKPHTLDDIKKELQKGLPVAVWIHTGSFAYLHSIVITGIDDIAKTICYNDPIYGQKTISQSEFVTKWEQGQALMIKTEIGRINRYTLEPWQQELSDEQP